MKTNKSRKNRKILFISLGCDKNLVDSEKMLGLLKEKGYEITDDEEEADIVIINTCCFINDAKQESIDTILEIAELRKNGNIQALVVMGCLAQRYKEEIQKEIPEVDVILGVGDVEEAISALEEKRIVTTGGHYAYLKIAEGCDKRCTYCIIPKVRGSYRSIPMDSLIKEAKALAEGGVRELILVAQEITVYGTDLYGEKRLSELLDRLCRIDGIHWIRLLYCYPEEIDDALIRTMKREPKICHYLDLPIQHSCDNILKKMGRRTSSQELTAVIEKLRREIPDICIRTTLITGFPGETKEEHEELKEFVDSMKFDRLGVFAYSQEEDTPAASMPGQITEETKEERLAELMELQQDIAFEAALSMKGKSLEAMIEGRIVDEGIYVARTYKDAPNVDGFLFIHTERELMTGDFVKVRITGANEYDLIGELEDEFTE